jgi:hypothetical protein
MICRSDFRQSSNELYCCLEVNDIIEEMREKDIAIAMKKGKILVYSLVE